MSSLRGASGANKSRLHNVNSVYSGKNTAATKASGPGKHGLQPLGKATAVVRRMPPPATLPSLKAEHGQDPNIAIVPQGGTGWTKSSTTIPVDPEAANRQQNGSIDSSGGNAPDLRPTWAKSSSSTTPSTTGSSEATAPLSAAAAAPQSMTTHPHHQHQHHQQQQFQSQGGTAAQIVSGQSAAPPNNRDFPSLAASVAAASGSKSDTGSLKTQKTSAWGTNLADANVEIPTIPVVTMQQNQSGRYIGASTAPKPHSERKLPERFLSSQPPQTQSKVAAKIGIREKLARLSMESKEPSMDAEASSKAAQESMESAHQMEQQESHHKEVPVAQQQQVLPTAPPPMNNPQHPHQYSQPPPPLRSQDVRQLQPSQYPVQEPPPEWQGQERYANGAPPYGYEQPPPPQKLLQNGRGDGGYGGPRVMPQHGYPSGGFVGQQRFDERGNPYGERQIEELGWGDEQQHHMDNRRGMVNPQGRPPNANNQHQRYRIDSRSSTEADNSWQGPPPQHYGQQPQQGGPRPPMQPPNAGWYDNSGYPLVPPGHQDYTSPPPPPAQYPPPPGNNYNQRSRNSSVANEYYEPQQQQQPRGPPPRQYDSRQQGGYPPQQHQQGGYHQGGYHDVPPPPQHPHDNQQQQQRNMPPSQGRHGPPPQQQPPPQQHQQQQQRYQQAEMPYRMLKRNDEKSAEYIAHHGGGPILQHQGSEEEPKVKKESNKQRSQKEAEKSEQSSKATPPRENVWEKRMEAQKKEERAAPKQNTRYQQDLDYNFPSINEAPKEAPKDNNQWNPAPPPQPPVSDPSNNKNSRKGQRRNDPNGYQQQQQQQQRAPPVVQAPPPPREPIDAESIGATHWVQQQTGPSWDNLSIPTDHRVEEGTEEDDNVYTGTKREFVNSKRGRGAGQFKSSGDFASRDIRQQQPQQQQQQQQQPRRAGDSSGAVNGSKKPTQKPAYDNTSKRPSKTEDNFSNMGEFHAEDYTLPEEPTVTTTAATTTTTGSSSSNSKKSHRPRDTFDNIETFDSSRRGSKRGAPRQPRGNNNWKGSERPKNSESTPRESEEPSYYERQHDTVSSRGNGRKLAPMGGRGRFLSKHTSKPARHKNSEGLTPPIMNSSKQNRSSADRSIEGIKSPVASEGVDEWETASESSDIGGRDEPPPPQQQHHQQQEHRKHLTNGNRAAKNQEEKEVTSEDSNPASSKQASSTRSNQKNVKPASHTFQGNGVSAKSNSAYNRNSNGSNQQLPPNNSNANNSSNKQRLNNADNAKLESKEIARENRKGYGSHYGNPTQTRSVTTTTTSSVHNNGLAGVDINDASVIVIDNQPDVLMRDDANSEEAGDFEEVLSKKQKKQRQLQVEEERKKEQREREKAERIAAKKNKALQKKNESHNNKSSRKSQEKSTPVDNVTSESKRNRNAVQQLPPTAAAVAQSGSKNVDLGTSVWNNSLVSSPATTPIVEKPHIPSPIARPTKSMTTTPSSNSIISSTPSLTVDVNAVKENFENFATSTVTTATTSAACYDFSSLKTASPIGAKSSPKPVTNEVVSSKPDSDHVQLKEKLDKVKDFWPGQVDFEQALENGAHIDKTSLSQAHGPNVAKVKPQPQLPDQQQQQQITFIAPEAKSKPIEAFNGGFAIPPSQSPNIYHRGGNAVFTMGPPSPFRQQPTQHNQIFPMAYGSTDFVYGHHASSPPNQSFFGQPSRPQSYDGIFNASNQLWSNGIELLSTTMNPTPPLQSQQPQQQMQQNNHQGRYLNNNSRPQSTSIQTTGFPHFPPPVPNMGFQQPLQLHHHHPQHPPPSNTYIPTHIPPPTLQHGYIEMISGPPPPIGPSRNGNNGNSNVRGNSQQSQQNFRAPHNQPQQVQILRPQFNYTVPNGVQFPPPPLHLQQHQQPAPNMGRNNQMPMQHQYQHHQNWQAKHPQQQPSAAPPPTSNNNFGGYFNIKYSTNQQQPTA